MFLDLSTPSAVLGSLGARIGACLPELCEKRDGSILISKHSVVLSKAQDNELLQMLTKANSFATTTLHGVPDGMPPGLFH